MNNYEKIKQMTVDEMAKQLLSLEEQLKRAEKTMQEIWDRLGKTSDELLRKEQECEELKSDNLQEVGQLKFAIGTLTAENLHLKELLDMRIEALCDSCKAGSMLPIKCRIYEKTLTEIKELCKRQDLNQGSRCIHILQKISECEGNDE